MVSQRDAYEFRAPRRRLDDVDSQWSAYAYTQQIYDTVTYSNTLFAEFINLRNLLHYLLYDFVR